MEETFEDGVGRIARAYAVGPPSFSPGSMAAGSATEHRSRARWAYDLRGEAEILRKNADATPEGLAILTLLISDLLTRQRTPPDGDRNVQIGMDVALIGPFEDGAYRLVVEGFEVPYVRVRPGSRTLGDFRGEPDPSGWDVVLDGRLLFHVPKDRAEQTFLLVANAAAIGAGWSCFGKNRAKIDPFGVRVASLEETPPTRSSN